MTTDLSNNTIPEKVRSIYLIAICGTGMGALACMLSDLGYTVSGSDQAVYPPMSDFLASRGIRLFNGFDADHLSEDADLVVVGNAVSRDNAEVQAMHQLGLNYCSMPQAINHFIAAGKRQILVTGTHGKTTTASFIAWLLYAAGLDPSFFIGGIVRDFDSNYRLGDGPYIVLEGDEYDTAYFDKGPKFLHYRPDVAVLTSVEFDHADIFKDFAAVKAVFGKLLARLPATSTLLAFDADPNVQALKAGAGCTVMDYGPGAGSAWQVVPAPADPPRVPFSVRFSQHNYGCFETAMMGEHNLWNLLAGIAVGHRLGIDVDVIARAVSSFKGPRRRQEIRGIKAGVTVIDDFAHHPTAVKETIRGVKSFFNDRRLIAVFEPRTNSSRRRVFQQVYPGCFDLADLICIRQAPLLEKIPALERFSSDQLVQDLRQRGLSAHCFLDTDAVLDFLVARVRPGDVVLIMSNGGFDNIHQRLLDRL